MVIPKTLSSCAPTPAVLTHPVGASTKFDPPQVPEETLYTWNAASNPATGVTVTPWLVAVAVNLNQTSLTVAPAPEQVGETTPLVDVVVALTTLVVLTAAVSK